MPKSLSTDELLETVRIWAAAKHPGRLVTRVRIDLHDGGRFDAAMPVAAAPDPGSLLTPVQEAILEALDGAAMRADELGAVIGDKRRLYHPGGIKELREQGLVDLHRQLGYYRPDSPPPQLAGGQA
jgi:hypothetical protein